MKKFKKIAYIFLIIIIIVLSFMLYTNVSKGKDGEQSEKKISEIEFMENKLIALLNQMNNIETKNYNISVSEISKQKSSSNSEDSKSNSSSNSDSGSNSNQEDSSNSTGSSKETENGKKFELKPAGVLTNTDEINWDNIKSEIETLYSSVPAITLDLYQLNISQEDVLGFNKELDKLTVAASEEKKEETLSELSKLYEYTSIFMQNASDDEVQKTVIDTKSNIIKAYSKLDSKKWNEISKDTKQAIDTYSKLLTNTNIDSSKQYNLSKVYIMMNELQNAVEVQNESVFLIKYKNLVEEINNLI